MNKIESQSKISILVVDDEVAILETINDSLIGLGYQVDTESNPKKALEKIKSKFYDIVISDIMMPEVTGMEIAKAVKATGQDTLVIIITGYASLGTAVKAIKYGVYDYIEKPISNIQNLVKHAVDYLRLKRKNYQLTKRIEDTLAKISLLHDISSILYQISDFEVSSEMILDTISEGFKLQKIAIMIKENQQLSFKISKSKNIDIGFCKDFIFRESSRINNQKVLSKESTVIEDLDGKLILVNKEIKVDQSIKTIILIPINFQINTLGYLLVFTNGSDYFLMNQHNTIELLEIFSNQISPVIHAALNTEKSKKCSENYISNIIENKLSEAKDLLSPISFALVRLNWINTPKELSLIDDYLVSAKNIMDKAIKNQGEIYWQNKDTGLIEFPAVDLFAIEKWCLEMSEKIESLQLTGNQETVLTLKYACVNYPQSGNSPLVLANMLWKFLFEELEKKIAEVSNF